MENASEEKQNRIIQLVANNKLSEAARILVEAQSQGEIPKGTDLKEWLERHIAPDRISSLVRTCASLACRFCTKGMERCPNCEGEGSICRSCLGFAKVRCDICGEPESSHAVRKPAARFGTPHPRSSTTFHW